MQCSYDLVNMNFLAVKLLIILIICFLSLSLAVSCVLAAFTYDNCQGQEFMAPFNQFLLKILCVLSVIEYMEMDDASF